MCLSFDDRMYVYNIFIYIYIYIFMYLISLHTHINPRSWVFQMPLRRVRVVWATHWVRFEQKTMFGQSVHPKGRNPGKINLSSFCPLYIQPYAEFARNILATRTVCVFKALLQKFSWETSLSPCCRKCMSTDANSWWRFFHFPTFHGILISPLFH